MIGSRAGCTTTTGDRNVFVGEATGSYATGLTTGDTNTYMGYAIQPSAAGVDCELVINARGNGSQGKGTRTGFIDVQSGVYQGNNNASWSTTSDRRIKKNIVDNTTGLDKINQIQVRNFEYRTEDEIKDFEQPKSAVVRKEGVQVGAIAQEIETILPDLVKEESTGVKTVDSSNLTWYMINAIKELSKQNEEMKLEINELKKDR